jgi:uncharacterized protein YrrD
MTGLKRLVGLPVISDGEEMGHVLRGVLEKDGRRLSGLVVRGGLRGARWLPRQSISLLGDVSIIASGKPMRCPRDSSYRLFRVSDTLGARLGIVTDALIDEKTLSVVALQVSSGPVDDLIDGRWYATSFYVTPAGRGTGHVTIGEQRPAN